MFTFRVVVASLLVAGTALAQNLIQNAGFELGAIPTQPVQVSLATGWNANCGRNSMTGGAGMPNLFDKRSSSCHIGIPQNQFGNRNVRAGGNRYISISGYPAANGIPFQGDTAEGTLIGPLGNSSCYRIAFWASAVDGMRTACNATLTTQPPDPSQSRIEVVLRKGNNCNLAKVVYTSPSVTSHSWQQYSGYFALSSADATAGYDRIEFRVQQNTVPPNTYSHNIYLDDVELINGQYPVTADFDLIATTSSGSAGYRLRAVTTLLPVGTQSTWVVEEIDILNGNQIPNTNVGSAAWLSTSTTFQGYNGTSTLGNLSADGIFLKGHRYRIWHIIGGPCNAPAILRKAVYICDNC